MRALRNLGRRRFISAGLLAALGFSALWFFNRGEQAADWQSWSRGSGLGLSFVLPPGRVLTVFGNRIDLDDPAAYRTADYIALYPDGLPSEVRLGDGPVLREGANPAPFTIREGLGGSGGPAYILHTTKTLDGRHIAVLAVIQTEDLFTPSFAEAWAVWESLQLAE